jgi:hypothetical protein
MGGATAPPCRKFKAAFGNGGRFFNSRVAADVRRLISIPLPPILNLIPILILILILIVIPILILDVRC